MRMFDQPSSGPHQSRRKLVSDQFLSLQNSFEFP